MLLLYSFLLFSLFVSFKVHTNKTYICDLLCKTICIYSRIGCYKYDIFFFLLKYSLKCCLCMCSQSNLFVLVMIKFCGMRSIQVL